jgi:hypothetical protein
MTNGYIKSIFKDDDNNIHFISHDNGFSNKITPNGDVYHYELNDGNQYDTTLDNRKNLNDLINKVKYVRGTSTILRNRLTNTKRDLIDAKVPQHHIDMIDELNNRLDKPT